MRAKGPEELLVFGVPKAEERNFSDVREKNGGEGESKGLRRR